MKKLPTRLYTIVFAVLLLLCNAWLMAPPSLGIDPPAWVGNTVVALTVLSFLVSGYFVGSRKRYVTNGLYLAGIVAIWSLGHAGWALALRQPITFGPAPGRIWLSLSVFLLLAAFGAWMGWAIRRKTEQIVRSTLEQAFREQSEKVEHGEGGEEPGVGSRQ